MEPTCSGKTKSELESTLDRLQQVIESLSIKVETVAQRCRPVTTQEGPREGGESTAKAPSCCEVVDRIDGMVSRILSETVKLDSLINRLRV